MGPPKGGLPAITAITPSALAPVLMGRILNSLTQLFRCVWEVAVWIRRSAAALTARPSADPNSRTSTPRDTTPYTSPTTSAPTMEATPTMEAMAATDITTADMAITMEGMGTTTDRTMAATASTTLRTTVMTAAMGSMEAAAMASTGRAAYLLNVCFKSVIKLLPTSIL